MRQRILTKKDVKAIYGRWAQNYDLSLWFFYLIGFRINVYPKAAVEGLKLDAGDTVVDLGCGTGLNFKMLQDRIGTTGNIIGVDLSESMLAQARKRVRKSGWENVSLIQADMAEYQIPQNVDGILSTLAITMSPNYDKIINRTSCTFAAGNRMSIFELKKPKKWPDWLIKFMVFLFKSYGTCLDHTKRTPCSSIKKYFSDAEMEKYYFGPACVATGVA